MTKRMAVGPRYRGGLKLTENGEAKWFGPGDLIPEDQQAKIPGRFLRDKRVIWVEDEPVKKARPKPTPKSEQAEKSATPSPTSEGAGSSDPVPLEVTDKGEVPKKKRRRKKLFSDE